jgi:membrane-bound metal-dependent hydrolase YbcI (DUF457 family)
MSWAAHELESLVIHKHMKVQWRISYMALLIGALLPDFTKLPVYGLSIFGNELIKADDPWQWHRGWPGAGPTHSLTYGVLIATVVYLVSRSAPWALGLMLGQWSHVLTDTADSVGCMVFFPFSTQHYSLGMWQYGSQMGRYGDTAAYYSSLGGVWDFFWITVLLLLARRTLSADYFQHNVEPIDPIWPWLRRRFKAPDRVLRAIFRAYVVYGVSRTLGWFLWARLLNPERGDQYFDWSWGGPGWVDKAPQIPGAGSWPRLVAVTVFGFTSVAIIAGILFTLMRRAEQRRDEQTAAVVSSSAVEGVVESRPRAEPAEASGVRRSADARALSAR